MESLAVFCAGFFAALVGSMAGGGAGFISVYTLLILGLPLNVAVVTNKFGDLGFFPLSIRNFAHNKLIKKRIFLPLILLEFTGVIIGTLLIIHISGIFVKYAVTLTLTPIFITMFFHSKKSRLGKANLWWKPVYFFGSLSDGVLQMGSFIKMFALMDLRRITALEAAANRFTVGFPLAVLSVSLILAFSKLINIHLGIPLLMGNIIGAYFGSKIAIKKGNQFVRYSLLCLMVITLITVWFKK